LDQTHQGVEIGMIGKKEWEIALLQFHTLFPTTPIWLLRKDSLIREVLLISRRMFHPWKWLAIPRTSSYWKILHQSNWIWLGWSFWAWRRRQPFDASEAGVYQKLSRFPRANFRSRHVRRWTRTRTWSILNSIFVKWWN
jgi:hypothetical protein